MPPELAAQYLAQMPAATPNDIDVYPENWLPYQVFLAMGTQWRVGLNGKTGLDYNIIPMMERRFKVAPEQSDDLFEALQTLETQVLNIWAEQNNG